MLVLAGTFRASPDNLDAARPHIAAMIVASRAEKGCLHYSYGEDVLEAGLVHVTEHWTDPETLAAHGRAEHLMAWRSVWSELGIGGRDLTLFDADDGSAF